jgi:DNA-directed RNA polymerase sigma subunit (sigma70/sigma32)
MKNRTIAGRLNETELDLIQTLYGFGREEKDHNQILREKPGLTEEELRSLEASALRKLRHLEVSELKRLRRAG